MAQEPYRIPTWGITVKPSGIDDPFENGPEADDTRREDEPGDWCIADFDGECSRGREQIVPGATIRADSDGGWECKGCVDEDGVTMRGEEPITGPVPRWDGSTWRNPASGLGGAA